MILSVIQNNYLVFQYASEELQQNKEFILKAIKVNPYIYLLLNTEFMLDKQILLTYKKAIKK
jgi:hypothetical protein